MLGYSSYRGFEFRSGGGAIVNPKPCSVGLTERILWPKPTAVTRGFPKIRGTILGVPIIRTIAFWGLYWGPLILGNYHQSCVLCM